MFISFFPTPTAHIMIKIPGYLVSMYIGVAVRVIDFFRRPAPPRYMPLANPRYGIHEYYVRLRSSFIHDGDRRIYNVFVTSVMHFRSLTDLGHEFVIVTAKTPPDVSTGQGIPNNEVFYIQFERRPEVREQTWTEFVASNRQPSRTFDATFKSLIRRNVIIPDEEAMELLGPADPEADPQPPTDPTTEPQPNPTPSSSNVTSPCSIAGWSGTAVRLPSRRALKGVKPFELVDLRDFWPGQLRLFEFVHLASVISDWYQTYQCDIFKSQCYWFAATLLMGARYLAQVPLRTPKRSDVANTEEVFLYSEKSGGKFFALDRDEFLKEQFEAIIRPRYEEAREQVRSCFWCSL